MTIITSTYLGALRCSSLHGPSGATLLTDAPSDNQGKGEAFSPTDLLATALATCILTILGIVAERHGWRLDGSEVRVVRVTRELQIRREPIDFQTYWQPNNDLELDNEVLAQEGAQIGRAHV